MSATDYTPRPNDIAIIGLGARFPGARNVDEFWALLREGREGIARLTDEELLAAGVDEALLRRPEYVKAGAILTDAENFDAGFFGYTPREAELIDVQQRVFLETAWSALEHAGYDPAAVRGACGVFAGSGLNTYLLRQIASNPAAVASAGGFQVMIANDKDFLATRVSYKLNLRGPSLAVQTACSTSLVAVHLACQSLISGECDVALAGGVSIRVPQVEGYLYQEGMILSPDGHCRAFDAKAAGTVGGNGAGAVVLKRAEDALADGDTIHAIIRGSAVNNDGSGKVGYTAPSIEGQEGVIAEAMAVAGLTPDEISYVEAHGTGTPLGDPIEVAALTRAFRRGSARKQFCALGSVKTNVGHLDAAAGIAGLIKTVLALKHREIPATLHFTAPNPQIDFAGSPFRVAAQHQTWAAPEAGQLRCAGVSSFGIGGTNAHVILEEAPPTARPALPPASAELLVLSARTEAALDEAAKALSVELARADAASLSDIAMTLALGRRGFAHRRSVVARDHGDAVRQWQAKSVEAALNVRESSGGVAFLFPGQGSQFPGMAAGLYRTEPVFRAEVDRCAEIVRATLQLDVRELFLNPQGDAARLSRTSVTQPVLFTVSYALARLWQSWGVTPNAMLGHSIGEWVAACLAEVFTLEEALRLVVARGRLMEAQPAGAMLAVSLPEAAVGVLPLQISVAAVNSSNQTVLAGPLDAIAAFETTLAARGVTATRLATSHAFHTAMMEPAARALVNEFRGIPRRAPKLRWISNVTGTWIAPVEASDPAYWARHLLSPVRFADGLSTLLSGSERVLLECGAGRTLTGLARRHPAWQSTHEGVVSLALPNAKSDDRSAILGALGRNWCAGATVDWAKVYDGRDLRRVPLPTYPFERQRHWIEATSKQIAAANGPVALAKNPELGRWFYLPSWKRALASATLPAVTEGAWLIIADRGGFAAQVAARLHQLGASVTLADAGADAVDASEKLTRAGRAPRWILSLSDVSADATMGAAAQTGFDALFALGKSISALALPAGARLTVVATGLHAFADEQVLQPSKALLHGPARVLAKEVPGMSSVVVDIVAPAKNSAALIDALLAEARGGDAEFVVLRGRERWVQVFEPVEIAAAAPVWRERGVYLITGGLGGIGLALAEDLARRVRARLVLVGRSQPKADVEARLALARKSGAEILTAVADITNEADLRRVQRDVTARFGAIHGIIHAAGLPGGGVLARRSAADVAAVLAPKVAGTLALDRVFGVEPLDFFVLMSSLTAELAEFGQADYSAANAFLDAFATAAHRNGRTVISINWDAWRDSGMAARQAAGVHAAPSDQQRALQISDPEGVEIFHRALGSGVARLAVCTTDFAARRRELVAPATRKSPKTTTAISTSPRPTSLPALVLPRDASEQLLATLWEELLGVAPIGVEDDFFDLGGHSLLATQVLARLRESSGATLTLATFFENPTIAGLAKRVFGATADTTEPALVAVPRDRPLPLSFAQQSLWLLDRMEGQSAYYNEFGAQRIRGPLRPDVLAAALTELVRRHEVLRTRFVETSNGPVQEILPPFTLELPVVPVAAGSVAQHAAELSAQAFDLTRGPLLRARLLQQGPDDHVLMVAVHHIVFDGWSSGVFFRETLALYGMLTRDERISLPALSLQYADYALWQRAWLAGARREELTAYWKQQLAGALPVLALPTENARPKFQSFRGRKVAFEIEAETTKRVDALGRDSEASLFMTLLAAYAALLGRSAAQEEVIVGCPTAGRDRRELEPLIGYFINPLAVRVSLAGNPRFSELLVRVRETVLAAYAHAALPFSQVVEAVQPPRDPARSPIFQTMLIFQNATPEVAVPAGVTLEPWERDDGPARSDLDLYLWETPSGVRGYFLYNADLFGESAVQRLGARLRQLLQSAVAAPTTPLADLRVEQSLSLPRLASRQPKPPTG